jgi:hypothetical protein
LAYINEEGIVLKTEILKGIGGGCDEAAEYAVKHTKYFPGIFNNFFTFYRYPSGNN